MNVTQVIPFSYGQDQVRTLTFDDCPYFVAIDVCNVLGIRNAKDVVRRSLDEDEKLKRLIVAPDGQQRETWLISESGLYAMIMRSNKPEAKAFRKWVTSEVLPTLRKTGNFTVVNYEMEKNGQLALFPQGDTQLRDAVKAQMLEVAMSNRSPKVRKLLQTLKPLVFTDQKA